MNSGENSLNKVVNTTEKAEQFMDALNRITDPPLKALIVHNSDEVKDCFIGYTNDELVQKIMGTKYGEDIVNRSKNIQWDDEQQEPEDKIITMNDITSLYHDGDSQDGYTLLETK